MIKLRNKMDQYIWIGNSTALEYNRLAMQATGKKRMCPAVKRVMAALAEQSLYTALSANYTTLYSHDNTDNGTDEILNINLPVCIYDAINFLKEKKYWF